MPHILTVLHKAFKLLVSDRQEFNNKIITRGFRWIPNGLYLKVLYRCQIGRKLNLRHPRTYTEKLQWLKMNYRNPAMVQWTGKDTAKILAGRIIGEEHIIPTLAIWDTVDDIDLSVLPDRFVLKTTSGGGGNSIYICHGKSSFDIDSARRILDVKKKPDAFVYFKEWQYKFLKTRIIAEEYKDDGDGQLADYKFYCFDGEPRCMLIANNRFSTHNYTYFDMNFNKLPIRCKVGDPTAETLHRPERFDCMKDYARRLSHGFPHVRVDLYYCNGKVYFGELTFFDASGFDDFNSEYWDLKFGEWLKLPTF